MMIKSFREKLLVFFSLLYSLTGQNWVTFSLHGLFPHIDLHDMESLTREVIIEENRNIVFSMGPLKASGPDGLHALFYQNQWETVGHDVRNWVCGVFLGYLIDRSINSTLLVLIPKNQNLESILHFRLISLCNVLVKIMTKIITN